MRRGMQVNDADALVALLAPTSCGSAVCGRAGADPTMVAGKARSRGRPTVQPLAPRARALAATLRPVSAPAARVHRRQGTGSRGHSDGAKTYGSGAPTPLGHTLALGARRTIFWAPKEIETAPIHGAHQQRSAVDREHSRVGFWEAGINGPPGSRPAP